MRVSRSALLVAVGAAALIGIAACGSSNSSGSGQGSSGSKAASGSGGKSLVVFMPALSDNYLAQWAVGAKKEAAALGYSIKLVINNDDQTEEDSQVRQQLTAGSKPSAYVWWPFVNKAGVASLRSLGTSGVPVIMANQYPIAGTEKWWVSYAGVNDFFNAQVSAQELARARTQQLQRGVKLHSPGGNTLIVGFTAGYSAGTDRDTAFRAEMKKLGVNLNILSDQPSGFDATHGYDTASTMIAANKSKGIDFVYAENDALADGVIQALQAAGYHPGKDVIVVGGTCHGKLANLRTGAEYATGLQAALLEGEWVVNVVNRYLTNGKKVTAGNYYASGSPTKAPPTTGPVSKYMFIPNPPVYHGAANIAHTSLWGVPMTSLCTY